MEDRRREIGSRQLGKLREQIFAFYSLETEQNVQTHYRSAGVLPYAVVKRETAPSPAGADLLAWLQSEDGNQAVPPIKRQQQPQTEVLFLMGGEVRQKNNNKPNFFWSDFGGKREATDLDVVDTALREFDEETAGIFVEHMEVLRERMRSDSTLKVWSGSGLSVLFLLEVPFLPDASATFCHFFNEHLAKLRSQVQAKLHNVLVEGQQVAVGGDLLGTLNKCAVRWLSQSDFVRAFDMLPVDTLTLSLVQNLPSSSTSSSSSSSTTPSSSSPSTPDLFQMTLYPYFLQYLRCADLQAAIKCLPQPLAPDAYEAHTFPMRKSSIMQQVQRYHLPANHNYERLAKDHPWLSSHEELQQRWRELFPPPPPPPPRPTREERHEEEEEEEEGSGKGSIEMMATTTTTTVAQEQPKKKKKNKKEKTRKKKRRDQEDVESPEDNQEQKVDQPSKKKKRKLNQREEQPTTDETQSTSDDMETQSASPSASARGKTLARKRSKWSIKALKNEKKQARLWVDLELARLSALRDKKRASLQELEARLAALQAVRDQRLLS